MARHLNVRVMPYFVVVDAAGVVRHKGGMAGPQSLTRFLDAARELNSPARKTVALTMTK